MRAPTPRGPVTRRLTLVLGAACALALGACGSDPAPSGPAASSAPPATVTTSPGTPVSRAAKACDLVTKTEAGAALVTATVTVKTNKPDECEYDHPNGQDSIEITMQPEKYSEDVVSLMLSTLDAAAAQRVTGMGDAAIVFRPDKTQTQYHVWADGRYIVVILTILSNSNGTDAAQSLAKLAVARA